MNCIIRLRIHGVVFAALLFAMPTAFAGVITKQTPVVATIGNQSSLSVDKFDPVLGSLTEVRLSYDLIGVAQFVAGHPNPLGPPVVFFEVSSAIALGSYLNGPLLGRGAAVFFPQLGLPGGFDSTGVGFAYVSGHGSTVLSDSSALDLFTAMSPAGAQLSLPINIAALHSNQLSILDTISIVNGRVSVTYLYDEIVAEQGPAPNSTVPEPTSLAVFGMGALAMLRRWHPSKRRRT